jgi:hypothetical protein
MTDEREAIHWTSLVSKTSEDGEVAECLDRHRISAARLRWIGPSTRVSLRDAGVRLHLWKFARGSGAAFQVQGVEFVLSGMRGGKAYDGSLPLAIAPTESLLSIGMKLHPATLTAAPAAGWFEACFPEHRILLSLDANEMLRSFGWFTTREMTRSEPPADAWRQR